MSPVRKSHQERSAQRKLQTLNDPPTKRNLDELRSRKPKSTQERGDLLKEIFQLRAEIRQQHTFREQQRLKDVTAALRFFSSSNPAQADIDRHCGFQTRTSRQVRSGKRQNPFEGENRGGHNKGHTKRATGSEEESDEGKSLGLDVDMHMVMCDAGTDVAAVGL